ncbi:MAG: DUF433 domain-containing protein [Cyanobacteriota bacterium]|nr:DUF433 domain-containing protein [Cyanobacteriota bacterium]
MLETALSTTKWEQKIYHIPAYTVADASRYLHIPIATLNSWLKGRPYTTASGKKEFAPLIDRPSPHLSQLSFVNLVEAHVLRVIRKEHKISLENVRVALDYVSDQLGTKHPLIRKEFRTDGINLFLDHLGNLINASQKGQLAIKNILDNLLTRVEWDEQNIVNKLFPYIDKNIKEEPKIITISPVISFGKPTITGTGIPTSVIADLYRAGDSYDKIADEYDFDPGIIAKVIQFESSLKQKVA